MGIRKIIRPAHPLRPRVAVRLAVSALGFFAATSVAGALRPAIAQTPNSEPTRVVIYANETGNLKELQVFRSHSIPLGKNIPTEYVVSVPSISQPTARVVETVIVSARWNDDKSHHFSLNISSLNTIPRIDVYFFRHTIPTMGLNEHTTKTCGTVSTSDVDSQTLFQRYFACKELVEHFDSVGHQGTQAYYKSLRGWFYAAYHLATKGTETVRPYAFGEEIRMRMETLLEQYDNQEINRPDVQAILKLTDIRNKLKAIKTAPIFLVNEVNRLRDQEGDLVGALRVNEYVTGLFPALQKAAGKTIVEGISPSLLIKNTTDLQTKMKLINSQ